jgi:hypothetical protein
MRMIHCELVVHGTMGIRDKDLVRSRPLRTEDNAKRADAAALDPTPAFQRVHGKTFTDETERLRLSRNA